MKRCQLPDHSSAHQSRTSRDEIVSKNGAHKPAAQASRVSLLCMGTSKFLPCFIPGQVSPFSCGTTKRNLQQIILLLVSSLFFCTYATTNRKWFHLFVRGCSLFFFLPASYQLPPIYFICALHRQQTRKLNLKFIQALRSNTPMAL